ncbi:hypothetical protein Tco_1128424 [Tanacetum coccineum]
MEELCQPNMNGQGGPIALVNIQATDFRLKNHMIQQVQNSCQFHGLPGDDANKHLDKFLTVTQSMKQNEVTYDALRLFLFPYSLTHHATAWLTLRHRDTINAAARGTFMKRRPEECYDLIENMIAHHNDWDTSAQRGESSRSITSSSPEIVALTQQMSEMNKKYLRMCQSNQQVNWGVVNRSRRDFGGSTSYFECQAAGGFTQGDGALPSNTIPNPQEDIKVITKRSGITLAGPSVLPPSPSSSSKVVEQDPEPTMDQVHILSSKSTARIPSPVIQPALASKSNEIP